ncbi:hypothetical protein [uncultured Devosia sp.]|nr:hypothetical protein [uncultured Devosia sp.]
MTSFWTTLLFLLGYYWPFMAVAGAVGLVTGWLSLSRGERG